MAYIGKKIGVRKVIPVEHNVEDGTPKPRLPAPEPAKVPTPTAEPEKVQE